MQGKYINRTLEAELNECLEEFPAVAVLGPRQCGKSTLAKRVMAGRDDTVYIDLERPSDIAKLQEPELFLARHASKLICLDEIQRLPEIFPLLRSVIDRHKKNGQFLLLGSASRELLHQSSESLAGRIAYLELTPFRYQEIRNMESADALHDLWIRGGFPDSFLARSDRASMRWRENFIQTFLERDIPQLGFRVPAPTMRRLWQMCSHIQGQMLNSSSLGTSLGVSHTTVRHYLDMLVETYMLRLLRPFAANVKKRLVKSPKIFVRDTGILHSLLAIDDFDSLLAHPVLGASWETLAMENVISTFPGWEPYFYRTAAGAEIDLVLVRGNRILAFEFKVSTAPRVSKGFWNAIDDLGVEKATIIAPVKDSYPLREDVEVCPLSHLAG